MKEFLFELLQAVATAAIPVCAAFLIQFLRRKSEQIGTQIDSITDKALLDEVTDAVTTAVAYTSQTYVDALKKVGTFDADAQKKALKKSLDKAVSLLSYSTLNILTEIYGNLDEYLTSKIEAEVRAQKNAAPFLLGEAVTAEVRETPDVTTVAASTAAATAAAVVQSAMPQTTPASGYNSSKDGAEASVI